MLTRTLTAFVLAATPQVPTPPCKLAGPPVDAHWSGAIPPASTAEAPLSAEVGEGVERLEKAPQRKSLQGLILTQSGRRDLSGKCRCVSSLRASVQNVEHVPALPRIP